MQYPDDSDVAYWVRRETEERTLARHTSRTARPIHIELAERYAALIVEAIGDQRREA